MRFSFNQKAVYWAPGGADAYGKPIYLDPVEFRCRWEETISETIDAQGNTVYSAATVFLANDVLVGGVLFEGCLSDIKKPTWNPVLKDNVGTHEIIHKDSIPALRGNQRLVTAMLK